MEEKAYVSFLYDSAILKNMNHRSWESLYFLQYAYQNHSTKNAKRLCICGENFTTYHLLMMKMLRLENPIKSTYAVDTFLECTMYIGSERPGLGDMSTACNGSTES